MRAEIYDILRFWLDKGVDGFRLDSIPYIAKDTSFPEIDLCKYPDVFPYYSLGPHLHDYLHEMNREVFSRYDCTTVGEGSKTSPEEGWKFIAPERQELDMLYHFGAADIRNETEADDPATGIPYSLLALKRMYAEWDAAVGDGWPTIYLGNHDQPRMVSRFGSDTPEWRDLSAKMLTMFLLTMRGTPYWLAGDELGMTNIRFTRIEEYDDIDTAQPLPQTPAGRRRYGTIPARAAGNRTRQRPHALPMGRQPLRGFLRGETLASRQSRPHGGKCRSGVMRPRFRIELLQTGRNAAQRTSGPGLRLVPAGRC